VVQWAKDHGISTIKLAGPGNRGKADRLFMRRGKVAFCELKAPGKLPSPLQLKFLGGRHEDGFDVGWFDSAPKAIAWLKSVFEV
jgi:hypothetical protein